MIQFAVRLREQVRLEDRLRLRGRFRRRRGLIAFLAVMGPGLIAGVAGNDAGGITTYSVMGASTGLTLLWVFPITTVVLAVVQEMAARLGVVTGQGLSDLIRDRYGVRWTAFAMLVLLVANVANTVAEFAGAAAALGVFGVPALVTVPTVAVAIWALVLFSSYRTVERVFLAVTLVFTQHTRRGLGRAAIAQELKRRHIDAETIEEALAEIADDDELERATELALKRVPQLHAVDDETAKRRLNGFLARKGYGSSVVRAAIQTAMETRKSGVRFR